MRNLGIVAHIDAGKTTVTERMLFFSGVEHRFGEVDDGTTVMDWMAEERERGITISAAATTLPWRDATLNLVDTPGHVDFTVEVERSMRVLDGAVLVIDAVAGVQAQSETVWRQMRKFGVPAIAFVNKCDRAGADFLAAVESMRRRLEAPAIPIQLPVHRDGDVRAVIDLLSLTALEFDPTGAEPPRSVPIPAELTDDVQILRSELVDALAAEDEVLLSAVLEEKRDPEAEELRRALRARVVGGTIVPVLCGSALHNVGIQPLLDAVVDYLPSPAEVPPIRGETPEGEPVERGPERDAPACALAFKMYADAHGDLTFVRVYAGELTPGQELFNPRARKRERIARVLRMHADSRKALDSAGPGEIVALTGLKFTATGDTLCHKRAHVLLEPPAFPEPVITMVVEPESTADREKLRAALARLAHEDPTFLVREDEDTGQWLVAGMGELHLEVVQHRLRSEFHVGAQMGKPRVAYREALRRGGRGASRVDRALGNKEVFGAVEVELAVAPEAPEAPEAPGKAEPRVAWTAAAESAIPERLRSAVTEALEQGLQNGPQFGFPLVEAAVRVTGGESQPGKDAELAFSQAAAGALRHALSEARVVLLEPWMSFTIESPAEFSSGILADLNGRRAEVTGVDALGDLRVLTGTVPLANMFGYSTVVRSLSQGRAGFSMLPSGFREVPPEELEARGLVWN